MFNIQLITEKLSTLTDKFVEEAYYDNENILNVSLKPEKNFKKSEIYEAFLNLTLIAIRFKDNFQELESANEVKKEEEMLHCPPWTGEIEKNCQKCLWKNWNPTRLLYHLTRKKS